MADRCAANAGGVLGPAMPEKWGAAPERDLPVKLVAEPAADGSQTDAARGVRPSASQNRRLAAVAGALYAAEGGRGKPSKNTIAALYIMKDLV